MKLFVLAGVLLGVPLGLADRAEAAQPIALDDALHYVRLHHPRYRAEQRGVNVVAQDIPLAQSGYYPRLQAGGVLSNGMKGTSSGLGFQGLNSSPYRQGWGADVELNQTLYDFGRTGSGVEEARWGLEAQKEREALVGLDLSLEVARRYFECVQVSSRLVLYERAVTDLEPLFREMSGYVRRGQRTPVELNVIEVQLQAMEEGKLAAAQDQGIVWEEMSQAMGAPPGETYRCLPAASALAIEPKTLAALEAAALAQRPEALYAEAQVRRSEAGIAGARSAFLPDLLAVASAGDLEDTILVPKQNYGVGVGLKVPIFEGLTDLANLRRAREEHERRIEDRDDARDAVVREVRRSYAAHEEAVALLRIGLNRRTHAEATLKLALDRFRGFSGTLADWELAYQAWLASALDVEALELRLLNSTADLRRALGDL